MYYHFLFFSILFLNSVISQIQPVSDIYIYKISNNPAENKGDQQSSLGGTTFYVKGSGFDSVLENNLVLVGNDKATVIGNKMKNKS